MIIEDINLRMQRSETRSTEMIVSPSHNPLGYLRKVCTNGYTSYDKKYNEKYAKYKSSQMCTIIEELKKSNLLNDDLMRKVVNIDIGFKNNVFNKIIKFVRHNLGSNPDINNILNKIENVKSRIYDETINNPYYIDFIRALYVFCINNTNNELDTLKFMSTINGHMFEVVEDTINKDRNLQSCTLHINIANQIFNKYKNGNNNDDVEILKNYFIDYYMSLRNNLQYGGGNFSEYSTCKKVMYILAGGIPLVLIFVICNLNDIISFLKDVDLKPLGDCVCCIFKLVTGGYRQSGGNVCGDIINTVIQLFDMMINFFSENDFGIIDFLGRAKDAIIDILFSCVKDNAKDALDTIYNLKDANNYIHITKEITNEITKHALITTPIL